MKYIKKRLCRLLWLIMSFLLLVDTAMPFYGNELNNMKIEFEGDGSEENPYRIYSYEDLLLLSKNVDDGISYQDCYFVQMNDVYFPTDIKWNAIGDVEKGYAFTGLYDGNGYSLYNIQCDNMYAGMFEYLGGEVRNLGIESGYFHGVCVGAIASHGIQGARIINCYNKASVSATERAGGIVDNCPAEIWFCWNMGEIIAENPHTAVAGIASYGAANIQYSYSTTAVELFNTWTFSGNIENSAYVTKADLSYYIDCMHSGMWQEYCKEEGIITRGNTVFPMYKNGTIMFAYNFEPELFQKERETEKEKFLSVTENKYSFKGSGTIEDPFQISSYDDIVLFRDNVDYGVNYEGYYFIQTEDIYFPEEENWNPIGDVTSKTMFSGTYDGAGHVFYNIVCDNQYAGLFSYLDGEVRNVGIETGIFTGETVGSITSHGTDNAKIINCYNKATVIGAKRAGGITDNFSGEIIGCWSLGEIFANNDSTYLAGITSYGTSNILYSYSTYSNIIVDYLFKGKIFESTPIENNALNQKIKGVQIWYEDESTKEKLGMGTIVFPKYDKGTLIFSNNVMHVENKEGLQDVNVFAEIVLCIGIIILLNFMLLHKDTIQGVICKKDKKETVLPVIESDEENIDKGEERKKIRLQRVVAILLTLSMCVGLFSYATYVLNSKSIAGILNFEYFGKEENSNTDILFLGSSTMSVNIELGELWKQYGIAGYCIGGGNSKLYDNYYRLIEAKKKHDINMVVVDVRAVTYMEDYTFAESQQQNVSGLSMSKNKWNYVNAAIEPDERLYYFLSFPLFHARYDELTEHDFLHTSSHGDDDKGTWTFYYGNAYTPQITKAKEIINYRVIDDKEIYYLNLIIDYCKENSIDLLLLRTPDADREVNQPFYNTVQIVAEEKAVPFLDLNQYDREIGLSGEDFHNDDAHLNVEGARKCTKFLGDYLKEHYTFEDHRGDINYVSWDRFAAYRENVLLRIISDKEGYFSELARGDKRVVAIPYGISQQEKQYHMELLNNMELLQYEILDTNLYSKEAIKKYEMGANIVEFNRDYSECIITINGKDITISSPGMIYIVYDEIMDEIVDIVNLEEINSTKISHFKW